MSQIIKQPDVMVLFAYIHNNFDDLTYARNWDYYESMCEASSSLTSLVHSICSFDNNQLYKGYKYFLETAEMDLENLHGDSSNGIHAGCAAGAWYSIVRGLCGIEMYEDFVKINPKMLPWWSMVSFKLKWHGISFVVEMDNNVMKIIPQKEMSIVIAREHILFLRSWFLHNSIITDFEQICSLFYRLFKILLSSICWTPQHLL